MLNAYRYNPRDFVASNAISEPLINRNYNISINKLYNHEASLGKN